MLGFGQFVNEQAALGIKEWPHARLDGFAFGQLFLGVQDFIPARLSRLPLAPFIKTEGKLAFHLTHFVREQMSVKDSRADADSIGHLRHDVGVGPGPQQLL